MVGGATPSIWNFGSTGPRWSEISDFEPVFTRSTSAVTSSEKSSINTNRKSTTRFPMSLTWSSYVSPKPPKGGSERQNGRFPCKIALCLKEVCYKVSLCENCQRQSSNSRPAKTLKSTFDGIFCYKLAIMLESIGPRSQTNPFAIAAFDLQG